MNYSEFIGVVKTLNESNYSFGNETLYKMAECSEITDRNKLAGAIWIIGRAYAASPQRRSYGGDWQVKTSNDGREGFFDYIAQKIDLNWVKELSQEQLCFDEFKKDKDLLIKSIIGVLKFNLALSKAIEMFDNASEGIYCSNHISFCSKFLHFYYPSSVFIIDNYAFEGGKFLFNGKANDENKWRYICNPNQQDTLSPITMQERWSEYAFDDNVYKNFDSKNAKKIIKEINNNSTIKELSNIYRNRNRNDNQSDNKAESYIAHCARSYILACNLQSEKIEPSVQIIIKNKQFAPMTRLVDTVFLNIKKKLSQKELEKLNTTIDEQ